MSDDFVNDRFLVDTNILVYAYNLDAVLCSEDMQHNQVIEGVRIFNPLLA